MKKPATIADGLQDPAAAGYIEGLLDEIAGLKATVSILRTAVADLQTLAVNVVAQLAKTDKDNHGRDEIIEELGDRLDYTQRIVEKSEALADDRYRMNEEDRSVH